MMLTQGGSSGMVWKAAGMGGKPAILNDDAGGFTRYAFNQYVDYPAVLPTFAAMTVFWHVRTKEGVRDDSEGFQIYAQDSPAPDIVDTTNYRDFSDLLWYAFSNSGGSSTGPFGNTSPEGVLWCRWAGGTVVEYGWQTSAVLDTHTMPGAGGISAPIDAGLLYLTLPAGVQFREAIGYNYAMSAAEVQAEIDRMMG
jgi:hypothetical protein